MPFVQGDIHEEIEKHCNEYPSEHSSIQMKQSFKAFT